MPPAQLTLGTGLLSGRTSPSRARRIVDSALDAGITRIDTARAYGDGETERFLGAALRRRPEVAVVTKVGLGPLDRRRATAVRWRTASYLIGLLPGGGGHASAAIGDEERDDRSPVRFDERSVRASVDLSRHALRRDRLDVVLLHEFDAAPDATAVVDLMGSLVAEGAIAAWGVGTRRPALRRLVEAGVPLGALVQTTGGPLLPPPPSPAAVPLSVHSVLGPGGGLLSAFLSWLPGSGHQDTWERLVGPVGARRTAGTALLRIAASTPGTRAVLLSSRDPRAVARTAAAVRDEDDPERLEALGSVFEAFRGRRTR